MDTKHSVGETINLSGKTQKGKNRIREWGNEWVIKEIRDAVRSVNGPGMLIESKNSKRVTTDLRWIALENDDDFEIQEHNG